MTRRLLQLVLPIALVLGMTACGFQLRKPLQLQLNEGPVTVTSPDPNSRLVVLLQRSMAQAGVKVEDAILGSNVTQGTTAQTNSSVLALLTERWGDLPIALDSYGRAQELSLRYAVIFEVRNSEGKVVVPQQTIELSRDYVASPTNAIGTEGEREVLVTEMQREMAASILRRIDTVYRRAGGFQADPSEFTSKRGTETTPPPPPPADKP